MLTMDQALELLRDGERRQWLVADWRWHITDRGNGGVYIALIRDEASDTCLDSVSWDVTSGHGLTGFSIRWQDGEERTEYTYDPVSAKSWPLVIHRNFHGLAPDQVDLLEEFRHFHNLWHDRNTDNYYKVLDDGERKKVVYRDPQGALVVDTATLRRFCGARGLKIILQIDAVQFFAEPQEECSREISEASLHANYRISNESTSGGPKFGRLLGKRLIDALPKERCGIWPFEAKKSYTSFIIGALDDGSDAVFTSDPDQLADYFGKNPKNPNYLTAVHFRKEVLKKYLEKPRLYSVDDGYLHCGSKWGMRMDNDHDDKVVVFLGDLGRDLPESEQLYWRSFNVQPEGGLSETCFKRSFRGDFADPKSPELAIKFERPRLLEKWRMAFGFELYDSLHEDDKGILADLRGPISEEWTEFDRCTIAASKVFIDYLNESHLAKLAADELQKLKERFPDKPVRGIDKLQAWLTQFGNGHGLDGCVAPLRLLQELRSKSAAHRKGSAFTTLLKSKDLDGESPRFVYRKLILEPLLDYCRQLSDFADQRIENEG